MQDALSALYARYGDVHLGARYTYARKRLANSALVPSRVFNDSALWTAMPDSTTRRFEMSEYVTPAGVTEQNAADSVPRPSKLGDARHVVTLRRLPDGDFVWNTNVAIALGSIRAADVASGIVALLTSAVAEPDAALRADYRGAFPHTAAVLGQLFALDSIVAVPQHDGSSLVALHFSLHPDGLRPTYPAFAAYMTKYVGPTHYDFHIADRTGADYITAASSGPPVVVRARIRGHDFLPLAGGDRPLPDSLVLAGSFTTHVSMFTVGAKQFAAEFEIGRTEHERSWTLRFDREPKWQLPLATAHLLKSSLNRPFQGAGLTYRMAVRDSAGAQTLFTRAAHAEVHESTIMRFLGGLISRVILDQDAEVRREEFDFFAHTFDAMRTDFGGVLAP